MVRGSVLVGLLLLVASLFFSSFFLKENFAEPSCGLRPACPQGFVCEQGVCQDQRGMVQRCGNRPKCPDGFRCNSQVCRDERPLMTEQTYGVLKYKALEAFDDKNKYLINIYAPR